MAKNIKRKPIDRTKNMTQDEADYYYLIKDIRYAAGPRSRNGYITSYVNDLTFRWKIQGISEETIKQRLNTLRQQLIKELIT